MSAADQNQTDNARRLAEIDDAPLSHEEYDRMVQQTTTIRVNVVTRDLLKLLLRHSKTAGNISRLLAEMAVERADRLVEKEPMNWMRRRDLRNAAGAARELIGRGRILR